MSPTRQVWKPLRAKTRTAAARISRRLSSTAVERSVNVPRIAPSIENRVLPLGGMLVAELTRNLPGPFAGRELRRLGARVVRVEAPEGDRLRDVAPVWDARLNAGKESVVWDRAADPALGRELCARADVLLEGFRPGVAERLGIGPGDLPGRLV